MLRHGHWIVPRLDGAPYVEKPPLLYWIEAAFFMVFGIHIWAARLISVLAALGTCVFLWKALSRILPRQTAICSALILASSPGWILMAHVATFDMLLAATTGSALAAFLLGLETGRRGWLTAAWLAAALAFLAKGPVGPVLIGLTVFGWLLATHRIRRIRELFEPIGTIGFIVLAGSWTLLAAARQPGFLHEFWWVEQFGRFLGTRVPQDYSSGPWWFYVPWLAAGAFPWSLAWLPTSRQLVARLTPIERRVSCFGLVWTGTVFIFFSLSTDKAAQYLLPALPGIALALCPIVTGWVASRNRTRLARLVPAVALPPLFVLLPCGLGIRLPWTSWLALACCVGALVVFAILAGLGHRLPALGMGTMATFILVLAVIPVETRASSQRSVATITDTIKHSPDPSAPLFFFRHYDPFSMLALRLRRRAWIYDAHSAELFFAEKRQPRHFPFATRATLERTLAKGPAWLLVAADRKDEHALEKSLPRDCLTGEHKADGLILLRMPKGCLTSRGAPGVSVPEFRM